MHRVLENGDIEITLQPRETTAERLQRRKATMFREQGGLCKWCKAPMVLLDLRGNQKVKTYPPNMATIDHLRDRFDPTRQEPAHGARRLVLACRTCNEKRGAERTKANIEEQRRRSNRCRR